MDELNDFEHQLKQEAIAEANRLSGDPNTRVDEDGTVFEFDLVKRAWFPKINEDFIAKYQMSYGSSDPSSFSSKKDFDWSKPPSDINSEEYRIWYEEYCRYCNFYQNYNSTSAVAPPTSETDEPESPPPTSSASSKAESNKSEKDVDNAKGVKRPAEPPAWFEMDESKNLSVYITGLPSDIKDEEFKEVMSKVGLVAFDPILRAPKLKLYKDANGEIKGDGRCTYMKSESVDLAFKILDGYEIRRGLKLKIEKAVFTQKGEFDPKKKKRKLTREEKKKFQEKQDHLLDWLPSKVNNSRPRNERVCVIKNVFLPSEINEDPSLYNEIRLDMMEECKKFGEVKKVTVYDRSEDGIVTVTFKTPEEADLCIQALHGRWFAKRQLEVCHWDGKTKYSNEETEQEMEERLKKWHTFLEGDGKKQDENTQENAPSNES